MTHTAGISLPWQWAVPKALRAAVYAPDRGWVRKQPRKRRRCRLPRLASPDDTSAAFPKFDSYSECPLYPSPRPSRDPLPQGERVIERASPQAIFSTISFAELIETGRL
jgi:hypothetical protein